MTFRQWGLNYLAVLDKLCHCSKEEEDTLFAAVKAELGEVEGAMKVVAFMKAQGGTVQEIIAATTGFYTGWCARKIAEDAEKAEQVTT